MIFRNIWQEKKAQAKFKLNIPTVEVRKRFLLLSLPLLVLLLGLFLQVQENRALRLKLQMQEQHHAAVVAEQTEAAARLEVQLLEEIADLHMEAENERDRTRQRDSLLREKNYLLAQADQKELLRGISIDLQSDSFSEALSSLNTAREEIKFRLLVLSQVPSGLPFSKDMEHWLSSSYGRRLHPVYKRWHLHKGADFGMSEGNPIKATADGIVSFVGNNSGYGKTVVVSHRYGFKTYYGHLSKILVQSGQIVSKGETVALSGNTGVSTGPHLHYEIRHFGKAINPVNFLSWRIDNYENFFAEQEALPLDWDELVADILARDRSGRELPPLSLSQVD